MKREEAQSFLFRAIDMWLQVLWDLPNMDHLGDENREYLNHFNSKHEQNFQENEIMQFITDFYDYFYIKGHICEINYLNSQSLSPCQSQSHVLNNDYGLGEYKFPLLDIINLCNVEKKKIVQSVTSYVFLLFISLRNILDLKILDVKEEDTYIVCYRTRYENRSLL